MGNLKKILEEASHSQYYNQKKLDFAVFCMRALPSIMA